MGSSTAHHPILRKLTFGLLLFVGMTATMILAPNGRTVAQAAEPGSTVPGHLECEEENGQQLCKLIGHIDALPESADLLGVWTVGAESMVVNSDTDLDPDGGEFALGACVSVRYDPNADPHVALRVRLKDDHECHGDHGGEPGEPAEAYGVIDSLPDTADLAGVWVVDGVNYAVDAMTHLSSDPSLFAVGDCVEIKYDAATDPYKAHKIELDQDCDGGGGDGGGDGHHTDGWEFKGRIESLPDSADLVGVWTVRGERFDVTAATVLDTEYGPFAVGVCVEIKYDDSTTPYTAIKIEGERDHRCNGGDGGDEHDGEGELYGVLQAFPDGLIGEWQVGGWTFVADAATEFDQERGAFEVGVLVKVEFYVTGDNVNHATEIEVKERRGDDHHDDHGGNAYGALESFPSGLIGEWRIGGLAYTANEATRFEQEHGDFAVGAWVKVRYYVDANDNRIAVKIETEDERPDGVEARFVGFVEGMPASGFIGEWKVGGETFVAGPQTRFEEEHGALAIGAYVGLEYRMVDGVKRLHEMHTEVPPNAGDLNDVGEIESMGNVAAAGVTNGSVWRIGGRDYVLTDATQLNDDQSALTVGATALVNSYTADDGSQVATSVTGVQINHWVFLPLATSR